MRRIRWLVLIGSVVYLLGLLTLWASWDANWAITLMSMGGFLLLLEIIRD